MNAALPSQSARGARLFPATTRRDAARFMTTAGAVLLIGCAMPALCQSPATGSVEQGATPMDQMEMTNPQPAQPVFPAPARPQEWWSPFIYDTKFSAQLRTFYFNRDKFDNSRS